MPPATAPAARRSTFLTSAWPSWCILIAAVFYFANVPDIKTEDDYHLDDAAPGVSHSIWKHPHFVMAVAAQFFYVAAQAGIFSFFINYMTAEVPAIPVLDPAWQPPAQPADWLRLVRNQQGGRAGVQRQGRGEPGFAGFRLLPGWARFSGVGLLKKYSAHKVLGLYGADECRGLPAGLLQARLVLGDLRVPELLLHVDHVPDDLRAGIFGLGARAKKASAFIVMAIMGGAILPKLMGYVADEFDMSRGFIVPMFCFAFVAFYGFNWPKFSHAESLQGVKAMGGH